MTNYKDQQKEFERRLNELNDFQSSPELAFVSMRLVRDLLASWKELVEELEKRSIGEGHKS